MYEASRDWLPTISGEIQSPMGVASVEFIDPREPVAVSYVNGILFILYSIIVPLFMRLCYQENFRFCIHRKRVPDNRSHY